MTDGIRRNGNNYYISTAEGLNLLCDFDVAPDPVDKNWNPAWTFYIENDIDMSAYPNFIIAASDKYKFTGTFDGQGHSITMKSSVSGNAGLFRYAMNITIKNLTLKGSIEASNIACGFIVMPNGGTTVEIINCRNEADISGSSASACIGTFLSNEDKVITITNFVNLGDIKGSDKGQSYGIISIVAQDTTINLNNIYIDGKIEGQYVSGLIGSAILQNIKINAEQVAVNAQLIGSQKAVGFVNAGNYNPITLSFTDCYFNGTGASCLVPTDSAVTTTYKGVFDGEANIL